MAGRRWLAHCASAAITASSADRKLSHTVSLLRSTSCASSAAAPPSVAFPKKDHAIENHPSFMLAQPLAKIAEAGEVARQGAGAQRTDPGDRHFRRAVSSYRWSDRVEPRPRCGYICSSMISCAISADAVGVELGPRRRVSAGTSLGMTLLMTWRPETGLPCHCSSGGDPNFQLSTARPSTVRQRPLQRACPNSCRAAMPLSTLPVASAARSASVSSAEASISALTMRNLVNLEDVVGVPGVGVDMLADALQFVEQLRRDDAPVQRYRAASEKASRMLRRELPSLMKR